MNKQFMRQAQEMQARLAKAQAELEQVTVEGTSGGGAVRVTMNGQQRVLSVTIAPEVVDPNEVEMLQDLVLAALNDAQEKIQQEISRRLGAVTGGMRIPGLG